MLNFVHTKSDLYNDAQKQALLNIANLPENRVSLIQGPPGTGKTYTILGILAMILTGGARKILVCTPSNLAIDEIVTRVARTNLL